MVQKVQFVVLITDQGFRILSVFVVLTDRQFVKMPTVLCFVIHYPIILAIIILLLIAYTLNFPADRNWEGKRGYWPPQYFN